MNQRQMTVKRVFDVLLSALGLLVCWPLILAGWLVAMIDTRASGFFIQKRVGRHGKLFNVVKLRTMKNVGGTSVTTAHDNRITPIGGILRRCKIDELPQLWNVLWGDMSFVGPRPDVPGFADELQGKDRAILELRPGITGPATLEYRDEEVILAAVDDPETYNREVIWPHKVRLNLEYMDDWSLFNDLNYIFRTLKR